MPFPDHDRLDTQVNKALDLYEFKLQDEIFYFLLLLRQIAANSDGWLDHGDDEEYLATMLKDPQEGPTLKAKLREAWKHRRYKLIRDIAYLQAPKSLKSTQLKTPEQAIATERAWNVEYMGDAAKALLAHIETFLPGTHNPEPRFYARCAAIIQSSGMGKSRTVDEMAKTQLVIPMVLRPHDGTGYPPPDVDVRDYLTSHTRAMPSRVPALLHALFDEVTEVARGRIALPSGLLPLSKLKSFPEQFRTYMNHGMTMTSHGEFRVKFYERVIEKALKNLAEYQRLLGSPSSKRNVDESCSPLKTQCEELLEVMNQFAQRVDTFVILSFDEIHILGESYFDFRRALRALYNVRAFSLLLSTAGHMHKFVPNPTVDPSARVVDGEKVVPPFTELGFDQLAKHIGLAANVNALAHVSSTGELVKFGRPLWATRYYTGSNRVKDEIVIFAASKLLGGANPFGTVLALPHQLGCLAQRLPIEFLSVSYSSSLANPQMEQVHSHMRVVLRIDDSLETMITASSSEPILSEAAYWLMSTGQLKPAAALKGILGGFSVNKGERGELLVMLLLTLARDKAVGGPNEFGFPKHRWCSVKDFLSNLFVESAWNAAAGNKKSLMEMVLGNGEIYFSHFIKIHMVGMLDAKFLKQQMARGAAIACATTQNGVDLVIPFTLSGKLIEEDLGVILIQVKNDSRYNAKPSVSHVMQMSIMEGIPTVRLFFAMASKVNHISRVDIPSEPSNTFSFWIAGLSSQYIKPVANEGDAVWRGLLNASYGWDQIYREHGYGKRLKWKRDLMTNLRRTMYPGSADFGAHWGSWWSLSADESSEMNVSDAEGEAGNVGIEDGDVGVEGSDVQMVASDVESDESDEMA